MLNARSRYFRIGWLLAAVFQLLLPPIVSVADSRAEADSIRTAPRVHVEEPGGTNCPRVHPADCAVCRVLSAAATQASFTHPHVVVARFIEATVEDAYRPASTARFPGDPPQRAPPVLS